MGQNRRKGGTIKKRKKEKKENNRETDKKPLIKFYVSKTKKNNLSISADLIKAFK